MMRISIKNFILIDEHDFDLKSGLTSVTGETGAGKSIVFEAIKFLSGSRGSTNIIKKGKNFAEIEASFCLSEYPQFNSVVESLGLEVESDEIFIRRKMDNQGKGLAFINNIRISIGQLKEIGDKLFVIIGQHDAHLLADSDYQLSLIDTYGNLNSEKTSVKKAFTEIKIAEKELSDAIKQQEELSSHRQLLEYQLAELDKLAPIEHEYEDLEQEHRRLSNATELSSAFLSVSESINGTKGAVARLKDALSYLVKFDDIETASNLISIIENAKIELDDAGNEAESFGNKIVFDSDRYRFVDERVNAYYSMSKKLGCDTNKLHEKHALLAEKHKRMNSIDIDAKREILSSKKTEYYAVAKVLSEKRQQLASIFSNEINGILENLKMRKDSFSIDFHNKDIISAKGIDHVVYMLQSNAESERSPVVQSASGGELSRITLAINTTISSENEIKRFHMFDEIDSGISGDTASYVGQMLKKMSSNYPVVCITHIPHVAGMADQQIHVQKHDFDDKTLTDLKELSSDERKKVLATLLFGESYSNEQCIQASKLLLA